MPPRPQQALPERHIGDLPALHQAPEGLLVDAHHTSELGDRERRPLRIGAADRLGDRVGVGSARHGQSPVSASHRRSMSAAASRIAVNAIMNENRSM
jgi:hypothetical protein